MERLMNPFRAVADLCRRFEQRYVPWPLLLIIVLTVAAVAFGYFAP
jgi:hypothetical protein